MTIGKRPSVAHDSLGHDAEYRAARKEWYARLKLNGFVDIEDDAGSLSQGREKYSYNDATPHAESVFAIGRTDAFSSALHRYNFSSATDHAICQALADGRTVRDIKTTMGVGQGRVEKVRDAIIAWHDVGFNLISDVGITKTEE